MKKQILLLAIVALIIGVILFAVKETTAGIVLLGIATLCIFIYVMATMQHKPKEPVYAASFANQGNVNDTNVNDTNRNPVFTSSLGNPNYS